MRPNLKQVVQELIVSQDGRVSQFITRIPGTNKAENTAISDAIKLNQWNKLVEERYHYKSLGDL